IFMGDGNCATCHSLDDANSNGKVGPNLNEIKPDISRVLMAVTNGIGVMPAYQWQLSEEEIEAVATYVVESTN
ncbi:cytochrome c, partial [Candidatus Pelagibacter sp.]|nr:cytochrome c [Candidatus Pelagibacter sp.]